jgi:hypothetical protein
MTPIAIFFILIRRLKIIVKSGPLTNSNLKLGKVVPEAAKNALLAGAAGAIIGAAVGIAEGAWARRSARAQRWEPRLAL